MDYIGLLFVYWYRIGNGSKNVADTHIYIFVEIVALQVEK